MHVNKRRLSAQTVYQSLFGIGAAFTDGAEQAWIVDEVGEDNIGPIFMRSTQFGLLGGLVGALFGVGLASIRLNLPIIVGGALDVLLGVFLLFFMPENGFRPTPKEERQSWRDLGKTLVEGLRLVRLRPVLITLLSIELFYGLSSEGFDRLSTAHFLANFTFPSLWNLKFVVWFGIFEVIGTLLSLGATEVLKRRVDTSNQRIIIRTLFALNALRIVSVIVFGLVGNFFVAVAAYLAYGMFGSVNRPIYTTWLTQNIDARVRATVISLNGQMNALGQMVGGPPVGYIGVLSLRAAMVAVGVILSPVLLLLTYASRKVTVTKLSIEAEDEEKDTEPEMPELV